MRQSTFLAADGKGVASYGRKFDVFETAPTKKELQEKMEEFHRQKEQYERENKTFMSEERRKALSE